MSETDCQIHASPLSSSLLCLDPSLRRSDLCHPSPLLSRSPPVRKGRRRNLGFCVGRREQISSPLSLISSPSLLPRLSSTEEGSTDRLSSQLCVSSLPPSFLPIHPSTTLEHLGRERDKSGERAARILSPFPLQTSSLKMTEKFSPSRSVRNFPLPFPHFVSLFVSSLVAPLCSLLLTRPLLSPHSLILLSSPPSFLPAY